MSEHMDRGSLIIAVVTLALFVAALFVKGFSHDLFLEVGVFLVSVKIILMTYKNSVAVSHLDHKLDAILKEVTRKNGAAGGPPGVSRERDRDRSS